MTDKEMEHLLSKRTGISSNVVRLFMDTQNQAIKECLSRQEEVVFKSLLRLRANMRKQSTRDPKTKDRKVVEAIRLSVKPMKTFRKELNQWTSTA